MPGIPVGDHYPETHTASAPPQVPVPRTGVVSPRPNPPLRHSSVLAPPARPRKLFRLTPQMLFLLIFNVPFESGSETAALTPFDKHQGETVQADGGHDHQPEADPRVGFPE